MRAILRLMAVLLAGAVWLAPAAAFAQETPPATSNTPATDAVGPRELQNFSLSGNVTKPSTQPAPAPVAAKPQPLVQTVTAAPPASRLATPGGQTPRRTAAATPVRAPSPKPVTTVLQPRGEAATSTPPAEAPPAPAPQPTFSAPSLPSTPAPALAPDRHLPLWPWLLAALALVGGAAFLLWRRRPRSALAGGLEIDLFTAPEPEPPLPAPPPAPVRAPPPKPAAPLASGIVASRLRPSIELGVQPLRCLVEDSQVTIEFEIELFNAGTAPARAVLAEASLMNAGATQDKELITFFANPVGAGDRLDSIPPMRRINLTSRVVAPRTAIQEYEVAGRKAFVPVIAFNTLYEWSGGKAQTSAAYLVGRETRGEKLGPLHLDLGPRAFTSLGARTLPAAVRT